MVLHYPMNDGSGGVLSDASGHNSSGLIHNAKWVRLPGGWALEFDGRTSYVDCGAPAQLDIQGPITLMAWICPAQVQVAKEPGILGKDFTRYLLTYYRDRLAYWYIDSGGNNVSATAPPGVWSHVAGVFDGKALAIYVDGELARSSVSKYSELTRGGNFFIGAVLDGAPAPGSKPALEAGFKGMISEVKVYSRALSAMEIRAEFQKDGGRRNSMFALEFPRFRPAFGIRHEPVAVEVATDGTLQITRGKSSVAIHSEFSCPGAKIGFNTVPPRTGGQEGSWQPRATRLDKTGLQIEAEGRHYSLKRTVRWRNERIEWEDTLRNPGEQPVGILISHHLIAPEKLANVSAKTSADNPTLFFSLKGADFGVVAEDELGRLQFEASATMNNGLIRHSSFALDPGKSHTFRYAIYPLTPTGDVYELINRVRRDWKSNFTIEGPFEFFEVFDPRLKAPGALAKYLQRKKLRLVGLSPWLDYDPGSLDHVLPRDEYTKAMQEAARVFHQAVPGIKVLGCIETDWVALFPEKIKDGALLEKGSAEQVTRIIDGSDLPWKDSIKRNRKGQVELEHYMRGGKPQLSLSVYPAKGNAQERNLLEQARFLIEEVGLDGIYIDEFSQAWSRNIRSSSGWDGVSVEIDPETGKIANKYVSCGLAGIPSRLALMNYVFSRGKAFVANTWATSPAEQTLPALRFAEMQEFVKTGGMRAGAKPPLIGEMMEGLLGSPIGLGITAGANKDKLAQGLMLGLICYLRHGLVYYHYTYPDLPEAGTGSGEYGPINHMFPFTPVALHEGWIEGRERTITCRSGTYAWHRSTKPVVRLFGLDGREKANGARVEKHHSEWSVTLPLQDWAEIAVISD